VPERRCCLTCCRLGVFVQDVRWSGVLPGDSSEDESEQFEWELVSNCWFMNESSVLHAITGEVSTFMMLAVEGMLCDCDADEYEYSKGFVIAISELSISGVRGVLEQKSNPTPSSGVDSDVLKLYIFLLRQMREK
jgi:hypothetical protein